MILQGYPTFAYVCACCARAFRARISLSNLSADANKPAIPYTGLKNKADDAK